MKQRTELSYRIAAIDSSNPIGLLVAMYDTLAGDLLRAVDALRSNAIEPRCTQLNHAYLVLGHLESWLDSDRPSPLDESLTLFYAYLRARTLEASIKQSPAMLEELVELVLQIRAAWQQRESLSRQQRTAPATPAGDDSITPAPITERIATSHSA